jgi:hypothetical protein
VGLLANRKWFVKINKTWEYEAEGHYPAEAESYAVLQWRRDQTVPTEVRNGPISHIEAGWINLRPRACTPGHAPGTQP